MTSELAPILPVGHRRRNWLRAAIARSLAVRNLSSAVASRVQIGCHHRPAWGPVSPDHRNPRGPPRTVPPRTAGESRVATGDERSELALDGDEDRATEGHAGG